ncbi:hypothetical protein TrVE_jg844 [Triparma verrucosa]|uniref:Uncharacterized protein n=1 Tax=Triparma verrucosa TaxID=1606542 RepID=A0A9W7CEN7_9STRA|nr:hypothetical protein TrVE_jg844 [Triparma verrucosa]
MDDHQTEISDAIKEEVLVHDGGDILRYDLVGDGERREGVVGGGGDVFRELFYEEVGKSREMGRDSVFAVYVCLYIVVGVVWFGIIVCLEVYGVMEMRISPEIFRILGGIGFMRELPSKMGEL